MPALGDPTESGLRPWLRHYDHGVSATIEYPKLTMAGILRRTALRYPERPALIFFGRRTLFRDLDERVTRLASALRTLGLRPGDRVALFLPNCPQLIESFYAVWRAGCVAIPVNPHATGAELARELFDSEAAGIVALDRLWLRLPAVTLPPTLRRIVLADITDDLPLTLRVGARLAQQVSSPPLPARTGPEPVRLTALVTERGHETDDAGTKTSDPAVLLYTGGTTGLPKAAVLTNGNLVANACQLGAWAAGLHDGAEVMLSALPLVHGYAMTACMNVAVLRGWTQVLLPDPRDLDQLLEAIERQRVTVFPGVPTLYAALCGHADVRSGKRDLRSIEACISGAASLPTGIQDEFERVTDGRLVEGYGLTEASPATHCNPLSGRGRSGTIGLPLPDTDCRLVDPETETRPVGLGEHGVLCVSGPQVMAGYWNRPDDSEQTLRRDETGRVWLHTGDIATMDADGYFRIVDRKKDVIVAAGGLKVYPNEIENVLSTHAAVRQAAVIGVPPGGADQRVKAFVVLREGESAAAEELLAFLRTRLAPYKMPKTIEVRDELPQAFTGKVLRRVLADEERAAAEIKQSG